MTNEEFKTFLTDEFAKYPMLNARFRKHTYSMNELCYVLRMSGLDLPINTFEEDGAFGIIPSVQKTFIPSRVLPLAIKRFEYGDYKDDGKTFPLLTVWLAGEKRGGKCRV